MRFRQVVFAVFVLALSSAIVGAQTPSSARRFLQQGQKDYQQGNLDLAFEDFSRAIEISSHLDKPKRASTDRLSVGNSFDSSAEADRITVIDPFTALAYHCRGVVRLHQSDFIGAIGDFNAAIRISPRLAEVYVSRGVAYRLQGDIAHAIADFDRAISLNHKLSAAYTDRADARIELHDL